MDTDERLTRVEKKIEELDNLIAKLRVYATLTPAGRALLKALRL